MFFKILFRNIVNIEQFDFRLISPVTGQFLNQVKLKRLWILRSGLHAVALLHNDTKHYADLLKDLDVDTAQS